MSIVSPDLTYQRVMYKLQTTVPICAGENTTTLESEDKEVAHVMFTLDVTACAGKENTMENLQLLILTNL